MIAKISVVLALFSVSSSYVAASVLPRQAAGTQFITGACKADADCASACCGFRTGKCAGPVVAQERDGGCGFGDAVPNDRAAVALGFPSRQPAPAAGGGAPAATTPAKAPGTQFITGACTSDADCASACCGFKSGKCAGPVVAQERDGGCGFGDAVPNDRAAVALGFPSKQPAAGNNVGAGTGGAATPAPTTPAKAPGTQFITGACASDADCASACCGFRTGKCAGPVVAQERDGGCGFGDAVPNDRAAVALGFPSKQPAAGNAGGNAGNAGGAPAKAPGTQFITGACASDADCASACCGFTSGKCAGPIVAQERDGGCGFGDAQPNDRAAKALRGRADPERRALMALMK